VGSRRKAREAALQIFFQLDFVYNRGLAHPAGYRSAVASSVAGLEPPPQRACRAVDLDETLKLYWESNLVAPDIREFADYLCRGTQERIKEIDAMIEKHSTNWKISRMTAVDRNILRLATFELLDLRDIPHSVTINEAVEIAKRYGTEESAAFINGILDKIAKED